MYVTHIRVKHVWSSTSGAAHTHSLISFSLLLIQYSTVHCIVSVYECAYGGAMHREIIQNLISKWHRLSLFPVSQCSQTQLHDARRVPLPCNSANWNRRNATRRDAPIRAAPRTALIWIRAAQSHPHPHILSHIFSLPPHISIFIFTYCTFTYSTVYIRILRLLLVLIISSEYIEYALLIPRRLKS